MKNQTLFIRFSVSVKIKLHYALPASRGKEVIWQVVYNQNRRMTP